MKVWVYATVRDFRSGDSFPYKDEEVELPDKYFAPNMRETPGPTLAAVLSLAGVDRNVLVELVRRYEVPTHTTLFVSPRGGETIVVAWERGEAVRVHNRVLFGDRALVFGS